MPSGSQAGPSSGQQDQGYVDQLKLNANGEQLFQTVDSDGLARGAEHTMAEWQQILTAAQLRSTNFQPVYEKVPANQSRQYSTAQGQAAGNKAAGQAATAASNVAVQEHYFSTPEGQAWLASPAGINWVENTNDGAQWRENTKTGQAWKDSPTGQAWLKGQSAGNAAAGQAASQASNAAVSAANAAAKQRTDAAKAAEDAKGLNFMQPGAAEQYWAQYGGQLQQPSAVSSWWNQNQGQLQQPGVGENYVSQALAKYGTGDAPSQADFDTYYDRAAQKTTESLNNQLAARGAYGSSVGLGQIGSALADLNAQRAQAQAQYGLQRSAEERGWASTLNDLAQSSQNAGLARWNAGLAGATTSTNDALARWNAGEQGALNAQNEQRQRGQDLFNNNLLANTQQANAVGSSSAAGSAQDQAIFDAVQSLGLGQGAAAVAAALQRAQTDQAFAQQLMAAVQASLTKSALGGGGGSGPGGKA